jgi:hypothetical protein
LSALVALAPSDGGRPLPLRVAGGAAVTALRQISVNSQAARTSGPAVGQIWLAIRYQKAIERSVVAERRADARAAAEMRADRRAAVTPVSAPAPVVPAATGRGYFSFAALEALWVRGGGPRWAASQAASIAECESGGNPRAYNPSGASGLWQILGQDVPGNLFDPLVNAENAVAKFRASGDSFAQWVC